MFTEDKEVEGQVEKVSASNPCPAFVIECFRRNVIIDLDRTFFDIIALHDFDRHLSHKQRGLVK